MTRREINKYIRKNTTPCKSGNCRCQMCEKKHDLSYHHYIKVEALTHMCWYNDYIEKSQLDSLYAPGGYLCEDCHTMFHALMEDNYDEPELDLNTVYEVLDILASIDLTKAPLPLYEDYASVVFDMTDTIVHNLVKYGHLTPEEAEEVENIVGREYYSDEELFIEQNEIE